MHLSRSFIPVFFCAGVISLSACSTVTPIVSEWRNPGYTSPAFKRIMVGGAGGEASLRRNFEDEFVDRLKAAGIEALPSHRYVPAERKIDEANLKQAAQRAGADGAILARSLKVEEKTEYGPGYFFPASIGVFGRNLGGIWSGPYAGPRVRRYEIHTSEATLYDLGKNEVVWTATVETRQPERADSAVKSAVEAVVKALREKNLLPARP